MCLDPVDRVITHWHTVACQLWERHERINGTLQRSIGFAIAKRLELGHFERSLLRIVDPNLPWELVCQIHTLIAHLEGDASVLHCLDACLCRELRPLKNMQWFLLS